jgi:two-component system, NarL family, response regulator LiaR
MINICIVEDIHEMSNLLKQLVEQDGDIKCVKCLNDLESAVEEISILKPDIVLLDINLNGKNGIEVIRSLRERSYKGQFLICTVFQDETKIFESLKAGATGYILKRSSGAEIRQSIRDLQAGGSPMSPEIARRVVTSFLHKENSDGVLSQREKEILTLISDGMTYKDVGDNLFISPATVRNHLHNIYEKLQVKNKTEAINKFNRGLN